MTERGFRPRQKGVKCSTKGCDNWCVSNDLCSKCNMRRRREQGKHRTYDREYNKRYKRPEINKVCKLCKEDFITARKEQFLCSNCSGGNEAKYDAQKRHRAKHPERARARDIVNKRIMRGVSLFKQPCEVCNESEAEAHHHDYSKPLDITWLCEYHHNLIPRF